MSTPLKPGKTTFHYGTSDGYIGGNDTQRVSIDDGEIHDCVDVEEAIDLVRSIIEDDWREKVCCSYDTDAIAAMVKAIWAKRPKDGEEGS